MASETLKEENNFTRNSLNADQVLENQPSEGNLIKQGTSVWSSTVQSEKANDEYMQQFRYFLMNNAFNNMQK